VGRSLSLSFLLVARSLLLPSLNSKAQADATSFVIFVSCFRCSLYSSFLQVNRPTLCKNIIRAIGSSSNPQPFETYPIGHRVTWRYYMGMLAFLEEDYSKVSSILYTTKRREAKNESASSFFPRRRLFSNLTFPLPSFSLSGRRSPPLRLPQLPPLSHTKPLPNPPLPPPPPSPPGQTPLPSTPRSLSPTSSAVHSVHSGHQGGGSEGLR